MKDARELNNSKQSFSLGNLPLDFSSIFDKVGKYNFNGWLSVKNGKRRLAEKG